MKRIKTCFLALFVLAVLCTTSYSCSKNEVEQLSEEEIAKQEQNVEYSKLKSILPGTWEAYEHYSYDNPTRPNGWRPISEIYWDISYTFNSDGTCIIHSNTGDHPGAYRLEKNPNYIEYPTGTCKVILYIKDDRFSSETDYLIWLDGEYLRLCYLLSGFDMIPSASRGGEAAIRYKKK